MRNILYLATAHHQLNLIVIHGVGSGKLKDEIHEILKTKKEVKTFVNQYHPNFGLWGNRRLFLRIEFTLIKQNSFICSLFCILTLKKNFPAFRSSVGSQALSVFTMIKRPLSSPIATKFSKDVFLYTFKFCSLIKLSACSLTLSVTIPISLID
ncbi:MAG: Smr/MutS family protein [Chitinophagaceae bacterium]